MPLRCPVVLFHHRYGLLGRVPSRYPYLVAYARLSMPGAPSIQFAGAAGQVEPDAVARVKDMDAEPHLASDPVKLAVRDRHNETQSGSPMITISPIQMRNMLNWHSVSGEL